PFPYTTLFRSIEQDARGPGHARDELPISGVDVCLARLALGDAPPHPQAAGPVEEQTGERRLSFRDAEAGAVGGGADALELCSDPLLGPLRFLGAQRWNRKRVAAS